MSESARLTKYSFLLVNYNMAALVEIVVRTVQQRIPAHSSYEIIIADNSTDSSHRLNNSSFPPGAPIRLVSLAANRGFVDALNRIIPLACGDCVVIMHPDVELKEGCLEALCAFLHSHPEVGVVSPDLYYPSGLPNKIRLRFPAVATELRRFFNNLCQIVLRRKFMTDEILWDRKANVKADMVMSVCMMLRGRALQDIASIDPRLIFYYANDYLCARARQLGWVCYYIREAKAIHFERYTPREQYSDQEAMAYKRSPIAANPRMRSDYFVFLAVFYPLPARLALRTLALLEDTIELLAQFKRPWQRKANIKQLLRSLAVDVGFVD
jgi:N-acetylglucosaminyl-diphospho-decaprenol L-rhamnosyltransferase